MAPRFLFRIPVGNKSEVFRISRIRRMSYWFISFVLICSVWIQVKAQDDECDCTVSYLCDDKDLVQSQKCESPLICCRKLTLTGLAKPVVTRNPAPTIISNNNNNDDKNCVCKPAVECPEVSGANQLNIRFGTKKGECEDSNYVCCPIVRGGQNEQGTGDRLQECGVRGSSRRNSDLGLRITASNSDTAFAEFPWMMAILISRTNDDGTKSDNIFQCGASLITPNVVLTAAHCVHNLRPEDVKVRGGEWDTLSDNDTSLEEYPFQEIDVSHIILHDRFNLPTVYNDIALLILKKDFPMKKHISLICIPNNDYEYDPNSCVVTGWGKDQFGVYGRYQNRLRLLDLKLISHQSCEQQLRQTRLSSKFQLHDSFLCAKSDNNKDACKGDGGGPLVCKMNSDPTRYTQVGIVSWGIGCGGDVPGVYVDVARYKSWILRNSDRQKLDTRFGG